MDFLIGNGSNFPSFIRIYRVKLSSIYVCVYIRGMQTQFAHQSFRKINIVYVFRFQTLYQVLFKEPISTRREYEMKISKIHYSPVLY